MPGHHCHAHACAVPCQPELLMCGRHWRMVPRSLQRAVWDAYRVGQCEDKNPSTEWHHAADKAIAAVARAEGHVAAAQRYEDSAERFRSLAKRESEPQQRLFR